MKNILKSILKAVIFFLAVVALTFIIDFKMMSGALLGIDSDEYFVWNKNSYPHKITKKIPGYELKVLSSIDKCNF